MTAALAMLAGLIAAAGAAPPAAAGVSPGQTLRVSQQTGGAPSQQPNLHPAVSGDGRWVVFSSRDQLDTSALPDDTPTPQIFVRDLMNDTTRLLSFTYSGEGLDTKADPGNGTSDFPTISADGRFVAFQTNSSIVNDDRPNKIILVDRDPDGNGTLDEPIGSTISLGFTLVSDEGEFPDPAFNPSISVSAANGIQVVFEEQPDGPSRLVRARATPTITPGLYSVTHQAVFPNAPAGQFLAQAWAPTISGDGERVVANAIFLSVPTIAMAPAQTAPAAAVTAAAAQSFGDSVQVVAFDLDAVNPDGGGVPAIRLDVFPVTQPIGHRQDSRPRISGDGRTAVFEVTVLPCSSCAIEPRAFLADPDSNGDGAIGPAVVPELLSRNTAGDPVPAITPAISADGRYAAFATDALLTHNGVDRPAGDFGCTTQFSDPVPFAKAAQVLSACQIVVRDLVLDANLAAADPPTRLPGELASPSVNTDCPGFTPGDTCASDGVAELPALSGDGGVVVYSSDAEDLVAGDDNGEIDVFARRFTPTVQVGTIDFGDVQIGDEVSLGSTVTPVGFGPLRIESVAVTGTDFTLDTHTCNAVLHVENNCAVSITFGPATEGDHTGFLEIKPAFVGVQSFPISGVGTPLPQPDPVFAVQPNPLNFGERLVFTDSPAAAVTVTNLGGRPLTIATVSLPPLLAPSAPGDYRIAVDTCSGATLGAGQSCTVTLVHQPQAPGERPAVLQFDQQTPTPGVVQPHLVQLTGAGTAPSIQVNPGVVPVGRLTTVTGTGFPPGRVVTIGMPGFPELVRVTPNSAGLFSQSLQIFPNAVAGGRVVQATVDGTAIGDSKPLLVVPGSIGPPDFLVRR